MKELVLSLLSRGYSHVVQTDGKKQYGRLEVCFEPEVFTNHTGCNQAVSRLQLEHPAVFRAYTSLDGRLYQCSV